MLEGLEISEVLLSKLEFSGRIDSEYYMPKFLKYEEIIKQNNGVCLGELSKFLIGPFGSSFDTSKYIEDGEYRYVRGQDVKPFILKDGENRYLPESDFRRLIKYSLKERDILVSVVGTLGNACIVQKKDIPAIFSCKSTVIRTEKVNPVYTLTYLNSKYGKELLLRKERGAIQKGLNLDDLKSVILPVFSEVFQEKVETIFFLAQNKINSSKSLNIQAETLLLESIGLKDFTPSNEKVNIKSFKDSFIATGRLDAEYYQKKYEYIENVIKSNANGFTSIWQEFDLIKNLSKKEKATYNYIEIGDINVVDGTASYNLICTKELPANAKTEVIKNDILVSKVRPNRGAISIIDFDVDNLIVSGAFSVLREKKGSIFSSETLKVILRTSLYKEWSLQFNIGTQYPVIKDEDILNLPIPRIDKKIQEEITLKIRQAQSLKKESEDLLDLAKRMVEVEIEEGEEKAIKMKIINNE